MYNWHRISNNNTTTTHLYTLHHTRPIKIIIRYTTVYDILPSDPKKRIIQRDSAKLRWRRGGQEEVRMEAVTDPMKYFCRAKSLLIAEVV